MTKENGPLLSRRDLLIKGGSGRPGAGRRSG